MNCRHCGCPLKDTLGHGPGKWAHVERKECNNPVPYAVCEICKTAMAENMWGNCRTCELAEWGDHYL